MSPFTNKELYMMNAGQKHFIGKDGFADVYNATPAEEAEWAKEIVENAVAKISTEENSSVLQSAVEALVFHKYKSHDTVLLNSIQGASAARQLAFANSLWRMNCNENDFDIVFKILLHNNASCINDLFQEPARFKNHMGARYFLIKCLQGNDEYLFEKAQTVLSIWAWSGLPQLRENSALDWLQFNNRDLPKSKAAIKRLKEILIINN